MGLVVVGVDGSDGAKRALRFAVEEARCRDATLRVVLCPVGLFWYSQGFASPEKVQQDAASLLDSVIDEVVGDDPSVTVQRRVVDVEDPRKVLVGMSDDADLLVVGSRGHGGVAGLLLGSVSQHVVSHARCPVAVVPAGDRG